MTRTFILVLGAALQTTAFTAAHAAETYPAKPIRVLIPFAPGGATDVLARAVSEKLGQLLGTSIVIDNRGGAGGTLGTALLVNAPADGYSVLITSPAITFTPSVYKNLPYNVDRDLKAITMLAQSPNIVAVHPSLPVKNIKELIALARKRPGEIHYSSGGHGSNIHLTTALFTHMANAKLTHVPYKGGGPAQIALISGEVQLLMAGLQPVKPFLKSGRVRALAVTTKERSPAVPDIPTVNESGVPGYSKFYWAGFFAPAKVPDTIVNQLYQAMVSALKDPEIAKRLSFDGSTPVGNAPREFGAFIRTEIEEWAKLISSIKL